MDLEQDINNPENNFIKVNSAIEQNVNDIDNSPHDLKSEYSFEKDPGTQQIYTNNSN